jgi:DNA repair ATPase RecN
MRCRGAIIVRMQSGNGIDLNAVYQLLREVARTVRAQDERLKLVEQRLDDQTGKLNEIIGTVNEYSRRFDQVAAVLNEHGRKLDDLGHGQTTLRSTVSHYHNTVVGHGMMSAFEEPLKRVEEHLRLDPASA